MKAREKFFRRRLLGIAAAIVCTAGLLACNGIGKGGTQVVFTTGFGKDEVFRIGNEVCTKSEMMVYLTNIQNQYAEVYGEKIWDVSLDGVTLEQNVKDIVLAKLAQIKTMYLLAGEKEIELDEQEKDGAAKAAEEYFQSLNETEAELLGVDEELITKMYTEYATAYKVYQYIIQDVNPEISDDEARIITVQQIFFQTRVKDGAGNAVEYSEEKKQAVYEKAETVRGLAADGEHEFAELASKYSDSAELTCSFGKGVKPQAYEEAAFLLETDGVSSVIACEEGYYILKCVSTFNREETDENKLKIVEQRKKEVFGQEYDSFVKGQVRNLNEKVWEQITMLHEEEVTTSDFFAIYEKYFAK